MTRTYYKGAAGCIIVYDITNRRSFEQAKIWKRDLDTKVYLPNDDLLPCILVANKVRCDREREREREKEKIQIDNSLCHYFRMISQIEL